MLKKKTPRRSDLIPRHKFRQDADRVSAPTAGDSNRRPGLVMTQRV